MGRFTHVNSYDPTVVSVYSVQYALYGNCQLCLYVSSACDFGNPLEWVVFGWKMPKDDEEFSSMLKDSSLWFFGYPYIDYVMPLG